MNIESGIKKQPVGLVLYGVEGGGKSTTISHAPNPLFLDTENGTLRINTRRIKINSWDDLIAAVKYVLANPTICKTLVVDTADWAEIFAMQYVCNKNRVASIEAIPFGKGYTYVADEFATLIKLMNQVKEAGINVVFISHSRCRKFELPEEMGSYDKYELKLSRQVAPLLKEWADALLFLNYKILVVTNEANVKKATGGKRVLYCNHSPVYDAKNRFGLPDELDLDYKNIAQIFTNDEPVESMPQLEVAPLDEPEDRATVARVKTMISEASITEADLKTIVAARGHYPADAEISDYSDDFIQRWIIPNWKKILETISKNKEAK